jgi:hypothetical protein
MRGHDLLYNVQAEPRSSRLGGMQRLEDLCQALCWYPTARIAHLELDLVGCALAGQGYSAPGGHGIERVVYQVEYCPAQGTGMKYHRPEGGQVLALYLHPSRGSQRLVFRAPALHRLEQVDTTPVSTRVGTSSCARCASWVVASSDDNRVLASARKRCAASCCVRSASASGAR